MNSKRMSKVPVRLCASTHYVWSLSNALGKGATGAVYRGLHKVNGESVAVKTFNHMSHLRAPDVQMREFDVLKKVNHINIVRLLAVEPEQGTDNKVLVMELCTGGSLYLILDDPENTFGIQEEEFLLVLEHVTAGMKHLRDNNIVHRDLKPGNIMKYIGVDGTIIYKLTDFGAARELPDDQQFVSLYGTEEYLHPDMYERAVLRKSATKSFGATVDLWSIGVTLYHVATGFLPFRPYGGRKNKETMYQITAKKESGVISGVQREEDGIIEWSRTLPDSCQLSLGLQKLASPLLAALMESNPSRIWSFDQYFNSVTNILNHRLIHIFHVGRSRVVHVFVDPSNDFRKFQELVEDQTSVKPEIQLFIYRSKQLSASTFEAGMAAKLETTQAKPVFLFSTSDCSVVIDKIIKPMKLPPFPGNNAFEQDSVVAKAYCSNGHSVVRSVHQLANALNLYHAAVHSITELLQNRMCEAEASLNTSEAFVNRDVMAMGVFSSSYRFLASTLDIVYSDSMQLSDGSSKQLRDCVVVKEESMQSVQQQLLDVSRRLRPLIGRTIHEHVLWDAWVSQSKALPSVKKRPTLADSYVQQMRDSWDYMTKNKSVKAISYHHEQFHNLEKKKLQDCNQKMADVYAECVTICKSAAEALSSWLGSAQNDFKEMDYLCEGLSSFQNMLRVHKESLDQTSISYEHELSRHLKNINEVFVSKKKSESTSSVNSSSDNAQLMSRRKTTESLEEKLRELSDVEVELRDEMQQNKLLVTRIRELLLPMLGPRLGLDRNDLHNS